MEDLEQSNAFVIGLDADQDWFRYHALLREMLQHRLRVVQPELVPELRRTAARWYGAHGQPLEALRHAADAEDWPLVGELFVTQAAPLLVSAERSVLGQVLARIPSDHQSSNADLAMCAAARLYLAGRFADMRPCLGLAGDLLAAGPSGPHHGASRLALLVLSTVVSRSDGDITALLAATTGHSTCSRSSPARCLPPRPTARSRWPTTAPVCCGRGRLGRPGLPAGRAGRGRRLRSRGHAGQRAVAPGADGRRTRSAR